MTQARPVQQQVTASKRPDWRRYELMKQQFRQDCPNATPAEYEAAMREIARMCGV